MSNEVTYGSRSTLATSSALTTDRSSARSSISEKRRPIFHCNNNGTLAFKWSIPNFHPNEDNRCYVQRIFTNDGDLEWKIIFYTCFDDINYSTFHVCLKNNASDYESIRARIELAIINCQDQRMYGQSIQREFFNGQEYMFKFVERDSFISENLLRDRNLVLEFKIDAINIRLTRALKHQILLNVDMDKYLWADIVEKHNNTFTDVILRVNKKDVMQAHSAILAARSERFRQKIITERLKQKGCDEFDEHPNIIVLDINDVKYEMLTSIVEYIYRGKVVGIEHMARELLLASREYKMNNLCILCEDTLVDSLNVENAADLLIYAHVHASNDAEGAYSTNKLKHMALEFIKENRQVVRSTGFKKIMTDYSELILAVLEFI